MPVTPDRLRDTFIELVRIPSPSRNEREVVDHIRSLCKGLGLACEEDNAGAAFNGNAGNLLVRVPATAPGPRVLMAAHVDTVESGERPIEPHVEGDDILSDGSTIVAADDKSGCAVLLELLRVLTEDNLPHGELLVAFTVAEEIEILGVGAMAPAVYDGFDLGIVLDHSLPEEIILGAPAKVAMRMTVLGHGGHGAFPERRVNAAHALATALSRLPSDSLDEHSTANLGIMRSGSRINIVPEEAYAEYEIRSHMSELLDFHVSRATTILEGAVAEFRKYIVGEDTGLGGGDDATDPVRAATLNLDVETCYECYRHQTTSAPVEFIARAIRATGFEPRYKVAQGGSDANVFNARGLPTAVIGCGMHGAHSVRERATVSEMARSVEVLKNAVSPQK